MNHFFNIAILIFTTITGYAQTSGDYFVSLGKTRSNKDEIEYLMTCFLNGNTKYEYSTLNGYMHGIQKEYYTSGKVKSFKLYQKGNSTLIDTSWFESGIISSIISIENDGIWKKEFYESKALKSKALINNNGKRIGEDIRYHENGQISYQCLYDKNGLSIGNTFSYSEDGSFRSVGEYIKGEFHLWQMWDSTGMQQVIDGTGSDFFHTSEGYIYELKYRNGVTNGDQKIYKDGKLISLFNQENGKAHGPSYEYYSNGRLKSITHFQDGNIVKKEDNFPMFDNPILETDITVLIPPRINEYNNLIKTENVPKLINREAVQMFLNSNLLEYINSPHDFIVTSFYDIKLNKEGEIFESNVSESEDSPFLKVVLKSFKLMKFDLQNQSFEGADNQIKLRFDIKFTEKK